MKNNFKRTLSFLLAVLMLAGLLLPVTVQAQTYIREKKDKNLKESYTVIDGTNINEENSATGGPILTKTANKQPQIQTPKI